MKKTRSNPVWFTKDPYFGWAFWKFRYDSYTSNLPHQGYNLLKKWAMEKSSYFSFTSNIDGFGKKQFPFSLLLEFIKIDIGFNVDFQKIKFSNVMVLFGLF